MELKKVIGIRRSIRFMLPYRPVERAKIQKMLEAASLASFWGNVQALRAVVIERRTAPKAVLDAIPAGSAVGGFQFRLAPVLIVWYLDWKALDEQGTRLHELVDAGAVGTDRAASHRMLDDSLIPFFNAAMDSIKAGGITEMDCGQGIALATLVAFEEGLGTCLLGVPAQKKLRRAIGLPDENKILVIQTVGYAAESREAGGQRPRRPFEERYFLNRLGEPFPRDPDVVEELKRDEMIQEPGPLPWREEELRYLAHALDLPETFGGEASDITRAIMEDMAES